MVSVTSALHYQSRPSMYIRGLIPLNWPNDCNWVNTINTQLYDSLVASVNSMMSRDIIVYFFAS